MTGSQIIPPLKEVPGGVNTKPGGGCTGVDLAWLFSLLSPRYEGPPS